MEKEIIFFGVETLLNTGHGALALGQYQPFRYPFEVLANNNLGMTNTVLLY
jgi:hypothetical protein